MEGLTRSQKRELRDKENQDHHHHMRSKNAIKTAILIVVVLMFLGYAGYAFNSWRKGLPEKPYTDRPVHWHAKINVEICGQARELPSGRALRAHGKGAVGTSLIHHHYDGLAHIEGRVLRPEDISLGAFFDAIGGKFSETEIFDKKNGDTCGDKPGRVKLYVNGVENTEWRNYVLKDEDEINIKFE